MGTHRHPGMEVPPGRGRLSRRQFLAAVGLAGGAVALTSARPMAGMALAAPRLPQAGRVVNFLDVIINDEMSARADEVFASFQQEAGIEVKVDRTPYPQFADKVPALLSSGAPPDLYWSDPSKYPEFVARGWLEPLDDHLAGSAKLKKEEFLANAINVHMAGGKLYGMPKDWSARGGYYNQDIFARLGITSVPETVAELKETALKVHDLDKSLFGYMWPMKTPDTWMFEGLAYIMLANGGSVIAEDATACTFNSPELVETMRFFVDIFRAGAAPEQGISSTNQDMYPFFGDGKVAMMHTGFWVIKGLLPRIGPANWDTFVVKGMHGGYGTPFSVSGFSIPAQAKNKEGAWKLIEHILQPQNVVAFTTNPSARPADSPENATRFDDPRYQPFFKVAAEGGKWWIQPNKGISDQMRIVHEASQAIILGRMSIEEGLADACAQIEQTLA